MSRSLTTTTLLGLAALIVACSQPRKAAERACRKADRLLAKAVWKCPDVLTHDSASITFSLPADSDSVRIAYTDPLIDSMLAACEQFAAAVAMDAELLQRTIDQDSLTIRQLQHRLFALQREHATEAIRRQACSFTAFEQVVGLCTVRVRPGHRGPLLTVVQAPVDTAVTAPCPPQITRPPCPTCPAGVATWWRTVALIAMGLLLLSHAKRAIGLVVSLYSWPKLPQG